MFYYKEHTADIRIVVKSKNFKKLLEDGAKALFSFFLYLKYDEEKLEIEKTIEEEIKDKEDAIVVFLNTLIYYFEVEKIILWKIEDVKISKDHITIKIKGQKYDPKKHKLKGAIPKAATYHNITYKRTPKGHYAEITIDI